MFNKLARPITPPEMSIQIYPPQALANYLNWKIDLMTQKFCAYFLTMFSIFSPIEQYEVFLTIETIATFSSGTLQLLLILALNASCKATDII